MLESARLSGLSVMATLGLLLVLVGVLFAKPAHAETFTVNSTNYPGTGGCDATECTLKEAINEANSNGQSDTIGFSSGLSGEIELSAEAVGFTIQNDTPEEDLTIDGPGADKLAIDGYDQVRPFSIHSGAKAAIEGLTIKNGASYEGGGILNDGGTLTVRNSTLSGNSSAYGGGIDNYGGTLTVSNSTLSGNSATNFGGGIHNYGGPLTVSNSTLNGNTASSAGGGIYNEGGTLTVSNSTLSGNSSDFGGGIDNYGGTLTVSYSTLSGNSAYYEGGGIFNYSGFRAFLSNTIVAGNSASTGPDAFGTFTSQGYNLIGNDSNTSGWIESDLLNQDPLLGPLADNGGPTHTHALLAGSPAINAIPKGTNGCATDITTDQRGVGRPQGGECEIGSFEDTSPKVKRVVPAQNATGVRPRANVSALFSEAMRKGSINTNTIKLFMAGTTDPPIAAAVSYDPEKKKAILNPDSNLQLGAKYKAVVTPWAKDLAGNRLDQDPTLSGNQPKVWFFTVRN